MSLGFDHESRVGPPIDQFQTDEQRATHKTVAVRIVARFKRDKTSILPSASIRTTVSIKRPVSVRHLGFFLVNFGENVYKIFKNLFPLYFLYAARYDNGMKMHTECRLKPQDGRRDDSLKTDSCAFIFYSISKLNSKSI